MYEVECHGSADNLKLVTPDTLTTFIRDLQYGVAIDP